MHWNEEILVILQLTLATRITLLDDVFNKNVSFRNDIKQEAGAKRLRSGYVRFCHDLSGIDFIQ